MDITRVFVIRKLIYDFLDLTAIMYDIGNFEVKK
jgi:hypothetical protein